MVEAKPKLGAGRGTGRYQVMSVTLKTGASVNGRLLAQTAVSMSGSTVVEPAP
jgi:hypothetical protein